MSKKSEVIFQYENGENAIGFNSAGQLSMRFVWSPLTIYKFIGVPAELAAEFQAADSKSGFFNDNIKGKFAFKKYEKALKIF